MKSSNNSGRTPTVNGLAGAAIANLLDNANIFLKQDLFTILNTGFKGFKYGFRIRLIHSLLVAIVAWKFSIKKILDKSIAHGKTLFNFAALFKLFLLLLTKSGIIGKLAARIKGKTLKNAKVHYNELNYFISGAVSGYLTIDKSQISVQMTLFLFSRVLMMYSRKFSEFYSARSSLKINHVDRIIWKAIVVFTWGSIMYFWKTGQVDNYYSILQSMDFIYSNKYDGKLFGAKWNEVLNFFTNGLLF